MGYQDSPSPWRPQRTDSADATRRHGGRSHCDRPAHAVTGGTQLARLVHLGLSIERKLLTEYFASARVYFHIRTEAQRAKAANLVKDLGTRAEVDVPGIERLDFGPKTTELRFFRRAEEQEARQIAETITALGTPTTATYIPGYEVSANIRPRHYELWLANPSN